MDYRWINNYTGEIYRSLIEAAKTIIEDMKHFPKCRTIKMLNVGRLK
ncbi:MAG: hypothetical protein J6112_03520 [Clostridia bacterium]|nr:hypothetical protein [Clostridia bacterium]